MENKKWKVFETHLEGVKIRAEKEVDILRRTLENFYKTVKQFAKLNFQLKDFEKEAKGLKEKIIQVAKEHEGLRGMISEKDNIVLLVFPKEKVTWNPDLLRKALGNLYSNFVKECLKVTIHLPVIQGEKIISKEIVERLMENALMETGLSKEEIEKIIEKDVEVEVDEDRIKKSGIKIPENAKSRKEIWTVNIDKLWR